MNEGDAGTVSVQGRGPGLALDGWQQVLWNTEGTGEEREARKGAGA